MLSRQYVEYKLNHNVAIYSYIGLNRLIYTCNNKYTLYTVQCKHCL